jgi:hypothetical protein
MSNKKNTINRINLPFLNKQANKSLNRLYKQLIGHNRRYRLFVLIAISYYWLNFSYSSVFSLDFIIEFFFAVIPICFLILLVVDKQFNQFITRANQKAKNQEEVKKQIANQELLNTLKILISLPALLLIKIITLLTRLPIFEDFFKTRLFHHRHRYLLKFIKAIETSKIKVTFIDKDQYHATFQLKLLKPVSKSRLTKSLKYSIKKYFNQIPPGTNIKLKSTTGQVLIPIDLLEEK